MQEAYRPLCIEYSFCCPTWVPPPPHPDLAVGGGVPDPSHPPAGYPPWQGTPPSWTWQGTPSPWAGYPPPHWCLPHGILGKCWKTLWNMGNPPPPCGQTDWWKDRRMSKHYLPVVLRTRAVIIPFLLDWLPYYAKPSVQKWNVWRKIKIYLWVKYVCFSSLRGRRLKRQRRKRSFVPHC